MARSCSPRVAGTALVNLIVASAARAFYDRARRAKTATPELRGRHLRSAAWLFCRATGGSKLPPNVKAPRFFN